VRGSRAREGRVDVRGYNGAAFKTPSPETRNRSGGPEYSFTGVGGFRGEAQHID